jgi:hypothetical protein
MQTQIITEAGTVIGIYDPKDDQEHLTGTSEVISKGPPSEVISKGPAPSRPSPANPTPSASPTASYLPGRAPGDWDKMVTDSMNAIREKAKKAAAGSKPAEKKGLRQIAADALPKSTTGKAAMVAVPAAAALAASESNRSKVKAKYAASRDIRHYRPASPYYDDGFGKMWTPKFMSNPKKSKTLKAALKHRSSVPRAAYDKARPVAAQYADTLTHNADAQRAAAGAVMGAGSAAVGAVAARRAAKAAAKAKMLKDAKRAQNVRDAALVGAVAAPVALGTRMLTRKRDVEKSDEVEKGAVADALKVGGKKLKNLGRKAADPATAKKFGDATANLSNAGARVTTNARSMQNDVLAMMGKPKKKPGLTTGQKAGLGAAGVGGLLIGRQLSGPKPYPYQQQR